MIKGDIGKESFARAQGKYLYQCKEKASWRWCRPAGIFIVYKLLLLELKSGRKGTKERAVSQHASLNCDKAADQRMQTAATFLSWSPLANKHPLALNLFWQNLSGLENKRNKTGFVFCYRVYSRFSLSNMIRKWGENWVDFCSFFFFFIKRIFPNESDISMTENKWFWIEPNFVNSIY